MSDPFKDLYGKIKESRYSQMYYDLIDKIESLTFGAQEAGDELKLLHAMLQKSCLPSFHYRCEEDVALDWSAETKRLRILQDGSEWDVASSPARLRCIVFEKWESILSQILEAK